MKRFALLLAGLAMALQSLWPLIAQARPRAAGELVPICTVSGVTHYLELPAVKTPLEQRSATHDDHCKLCVFAGAIVSVQVLSFHAVEIQGGNVRSPEAKSLRQSSYPPAHPRAPPAAL